MTDALGVSSRPHAAGGPGCESDPASLRATGAAEEKICLMRHLPLERVRGSEEPAGTTLDPRPRSLEDMGRRLAEARPGTDPGDAGAFGGSPRPSAGWVMRPGPGVAIGSGHFPSHSTGTFCGKDKHYPRRIRTPLSALPALMH